MTNEPNQREPSCEKRETELCVKGSTGLSTTPKWLGATLSSVLLKRFFFYVFTDLQALSLSDNHIKILAESFTQPSRIQHLPVRMLQYRELFTNNGTSCRANNVHVRMGTKQIHSPFSPWPVLQSDCILPEYQSHSLCCIERKQDAKGKHERKCQ